MIFDFNHFLKIENLYSVFINRIIFGTLIQWIKNKDNQSSPMGH